MPPRPTLYTLIYRSQASRAVHEVTLPPLLRKARLHNERTRLGGLLLYAKGEFMQVLEGPEPALSQLYARIKADPRHYAVRTLAYGPITERAFPDWRMAYVPADAKALEKITGFLPLAAVPGHTPHPPQEVAQLLHSFAQGRAQDQ
ncbi:BLUF domain-containing protein [Hymenobacter ruber]